MTSRGNQKTTPEIKDARKRKRAYILEWLNSKKNAEVQHYRDFWAVAISNGAHKKPTLMILRAQDWWHWYTRSAQTMIAKGITLDAALELNYPTTRPVKSEDALRKRLAELKGETNGDGS